MDVNKCSVPAVSHQRYNEMTVNEMTLFQDRLYFLFFRIPPRVSNGQPGWRATEQGLKTCPVRPRPAEPTAFSHSLSLLHIFRTFYLRDKAPHRAGDSETWLLLGVGAGGAEEETFSKYTDN